MPARVWRAVLSWTREHPRIRTFAASWAFGFVLLLAFMCSEYLKGQNYVDIFPSELLFPSVLHALTAGLIALVVTLFRRPRTLGAKLVAVLFLALCMVNYDARLTLAADVFKPVLPVLPGGADGMMLISLLFLASLVAIALWVSRWAERLQAKKAWLNSQNMVGGLLIIAGFLFVGQAFSTLTMLREVHGQAGYAATAELTAASAQKRTATDGEKPDIYYIVLDRYTNNTVLKDQFGFDNSAFLDNLRGQGYAVDDAAYSEYPYTAPSTASVLNLSYHNDDVKGFKDGKKQSADLFHNMNRQAEAVKLIKEQGYEYYNVGSTYSASNRAPLALRDYACDMLLRYGGSRKCLRTIEQVQFTRSPFYRLSLTTSLKSVLPHLETTDGPSYVRMQLQRLHEIAGAETQGGRLVFAHLLVPHEPFYFNADGSLARSTSPDNTSRAIKDKYLAQVHFINTQVTDVINEINAKSGGKAVVMLISDEGPYPQLLNQTFLAPVSAESQGDIMLSKPMPEWEQKDLQMKYGILQAVHIPKATEEDLAQMAPVNAFRVVLNRYFGYTFDYLPKCQMGMPETRRQLYVYKDISKLVSGSDDAACAQYE